MEGGAHSLRSHLGLLVYLALFLATFAVYAQVRHFNFVNYDDPEYTTGDLYVRQGLTMQGLAWALTSREASNWFPLTRASHMLDCQFVGMESSWHHMDNVLLHTLAAILLFMFLRWAKAFAVPLAATACLASAALTWVQIGY